MKIDPTRSQMNIKFIYIASGSLIFFISINTECLHFTIALHEKLNLPSNHSVSYAKKKEFDDNNLIFKSRPWWGGDPGELEILLDPPQLLPTVTRQE